MNGIPTVYRGEAIIIMASMAPSQRIKKRGVIAPTKNPEYVYDLKQIRKKPRIFNVRVSLHSKSCE